jgi:phosphoribosylformylglycinamidine cyclo-ligase
VDAVIDRASWTPPALFQFIQKTGKVDRDEMYHVFNMGIGMVVIVDKTAAAELQKRIPEETFVIGELVSGEHKVILKEKVS